MRFALTKQSSIKAVQFTVNSLAYSAQPKLKACIHCYQCAVLMKQTKSISIENSPSETVSVTDLSELIRLYISDVM
jgi:hypothetical protein